MPGVPHGHRSFHGRPNDDNCVRGPAAVAEKNANLADAEGAIDLMEENHVTHGNRAARQAHGVRNLMLSGLRASQFAEGRGNIARWSPLP